jgi:hypothetical protein
MSENTIGKPLYLRVRVKGNILCDFFSFILKKCQLQIDNSFIIQHIFNRVDYWLPFYFRLMDMIDSIASFNNQFAHETIQDRNLKQHEKEN